ncbi:MAG: glycosyltransferase [bacterium]
MKVAFYLEEFPVERDYRVEAVYALAGGLARRGHDVTVACNVPGAKAGGVFRAFAPPARQRAFAERLKRELKWIAPPRGVRHLRVPLPKDKFFPELDAIIAASWRTAEWIDVFPPDRGVKFLLLFGEDAGDVERSRAGAARRLPLVRIVLSEKTFDEAAERGTGVFRVPWESDGDTDRACDALERLLGVFSAGEGKHYFYRRRITNEEGAEGKTDVDAGGIKVLCVTAEPSACSQVRVYSPHNALAGRGFRVRYHLIRRGRVVPPGDVEWADVIVLQRVRDRRYGRIIRRAGARGRKIVFELDDNLFEIPEGHPLKGSAYKNLRMFPFIRASHAVTVSTERLGRYVRERGLAGDVFVFPNYVDTEIFEKELPSRDSGGVVTVGYAGSVTHAPDFAPVVPALRRILGEFGGRVRMKFLGFTPDGLAGAEGVESVEGTDSYHMFAGLLRGAGIDVGLAPLRRNVFNEGKSNIKYLEYSMCGIPGIYADVAPYSSCVRDGVNGLLVEPDDTDGWRDAVKRLIEDEGLRNGIREAAHADVVENYILEDNVEKLLRFYRRLLSVR